MPLLTLPLEILFLIIQRLDYQDLWSVYDTCQIFRAVSAPSLFRQVNIVFDRTDPLLLNCRYFRPSASTLLNTLKEWATYVREVEIWGDEDSIQEEFFDLLPLFDRLEAFRNVISYPPDLESFQQLLAQLATVPSVTTLSVDFMSPRTWMLPMSFKHLRNLQLSCIEHEPGLCVLPDLPLLETLALNFCCYCLDCPRGGKKPRTKVQFDLLPELVSFSISGAQEGSIICCGQAQRLRRFDISFSSGLEWTRLLQSLGTNLEAIEISSCEFAEEPLQAIQYPSLRSVRILDSTSNILLFCMAALPSLNNFSVYLHPEDFDSLTPWPPVWRFLTQNPVALSLDGPRHKDALLDRNDRLLQVVKLPNVRLEGIHWPRAWRLAKADKLPRVKWATVCHEPLGSR